ncbi:MAG: adenylosuccinate lyase, partial [Actinobacteria bacterium]|nr:adenylosuccinate lyase [Actinomycetota bacterium]
PAVIERELQRYLPFLATTKILMAAVRNGVGRETAHEVIKEHAVQVALDMRGAAGADGNALISRLAEDGRLGLSFADLTALIEQPLEFTGAARAQVASIAQQVATLVSSSPEAATYRPEPIL